MSATSTAGRDNGRASAGHLQQEVERACHLAERVDGDAGVECRRVELLVSEQHLDDADIGLLFQKMGGKAVPQRVNTDTLGNAGADSCAVPGSRGTARAGRNASIPSSRMRPGWDDIRMTRSARQTASRTLCVTSKMVLRRCSRMRCRSR